MNRTEVEFVEGVIYSRQDDIHAPFGGSKQSGISVSARVPAIFAFTGEEGEQFGYQDYWDEQGRIYTYTGEGQVGDMQMTKGNRAIADHIRDGRSLHLFSKVSRAGGRYRYLGEMQCAGVEYTRGPDRQKNIRQIIKFQLVRLRALPDAPVLSPEDLSRPLSELRASAYSADQRSSNNKVSVRTLYERSRDVAIYALRRANGICESCGIDAPFVRTDNSPYLEVHHIDRLSDGGLDQPHRVAAICPTCHRRIHFGVDGSEWNQRLRGRVATIEDRISAIPTTLEDFGSGGTKI